MLDSILAALHARTDLQAWTVKHMVKRGVQIYAVPQVVEAKRDVASEHFVVDVLRNTTGPDGSPACGLAYITVLPADDVQHAVDEAALMAGLVHNSPHTVPAPAVVPTVPVADAQLQADMAGTLDQLYARLKDSVASSPHARMTAAEFFGEETTTHLVNSRGVDTAQTSTEIAVEWVLINRSGEQETESFVEITRRRAADIDIEGEVERRVGYTRDLQAATPAPNYSGPVVMRGATLANFICGDSLVVGGNIFAVLGSARAKFNKTTQWEIGESIFRNEVAGDPLTLWATRQLPYGTQSNCFDDEGLPAQRLLLIEENRLKAFAASQRYADYLALPPTGAFGNIELPPGRTSESDLLSEPHVEIVSFSWFAPDPVTGEFASEIRLGYDVAGTKRKPFKGGLLVGNMLDALSDVRWSGETAFCGNYLGPTTARFSKLTVAGE